MAGSFHTAHDPHAAIQLGYCEITRHACMLVACHKLIKHLCLIITDTILISMNIPVSSMPTNYIQLCLIIKRVFLYTARWALHKHVRANRKQRCASMECVI